MGWGGDQINPYLLKYFKLVLKGLGCGFEEWELKLELTRSICKLWGLAHDGFSLTILESPLS